jgi:hypothetical protein
LITWGEPVCNGPTQKATLQMEASVETPGSRHRAPARMPNDSLHLRFERCKGR